MSGDDRHCLSVFHATAGDQLRDLLEGNDQVLDPNDPRHHSRNNSPTPTTDPGPRIRGSRLCGAVRFLITGPFLRAGHCHCSRCRKHSGAGISTQGRVQREHFQLLSGKGSIRAFDSAGFDTKAFCIHCGSSLFGGDWPGGDEVSIRLGALDDDPGTRPQYHTYVDSMPTWDRILDDLPQHPEALPGRTADASTKKQGQ